MLGRIHINFSVHTRREIERERLIIFFNNILLNYLMETSYHNSNICVHYIIINWFFFFIKTQNVSPIYNHNIMQWKNNMVGNCESTTKFTKENNYSKSFFLFFIIYICFLCNSMFETIYIYSKIISWTLLYSNNYRTRCRIVSLIFKNL